MARQPASISASLEAHRKNKQKPGGKAKKANCSWMIKQLKEKIQLIVKHMFFLGTKTLTEKRSKIRVLVPSKCVTTTKGLNPGQFLKSIHCS